LVVKLVGLKAEKLAWWLVARWAVRSDDGKAARSAGLLDYWRAELKAGKLVDGKAGYSVYSRAVGSVDLMAFCLDCKTAGCWADYWAELLGYLKFVRLVA
jgi:hypothetical protein